MKKRLSKVWIVIKAILTLFLSFFVILISGVVLAPVDAETNTAQLPDWFIPVLFFSPIVFSIIIYKKSSKRLKDSIEAEAIESNDAYPNTDVLGEQNQTSETISCDRIQEIPPTQKNTERNVLDIIREMEERFRSMYEFAYNHMLNAEDCKRAYSALLKNFDYSTLPLAAQVRLEQLCDEYKPKFENPNPMLYVDSMNGIDFENWCAKLLLRAGFDRAETTPPSGDQGVDIVALKDGVWYAIQCKRYASDLGNTPVQEVYAGKEMYGCQVGVVMTNAHFTDGAIELAEKTKILLWDRDKIIDMIRNYGR